MSFLHPALDALLGLVRENNIKADDVEEIILRFPRSGVHCIDGNALKSHCAQYILPIAVAHGGIEVADLFIDRRLTDTAVAELAKRTTVIADDELNKLFPDYYASIVQISTKAGATLERRSDIARGYPETALSEDELDAKFRGLAGSVASSWRVDSLSDCLNGLENAPDVSELASLLTGRPDP